MNDIKRLALAQAALRELIDEKKKELSELQKEYDDIRKNKLPAALEEEGIESVAIGGLGRLSVVDDMYVSCRAEDKADFHVWLEENGYDGIIQPTVHPGTLKSFVKSAIGDGETLPGMIKTTAYQYVKITKS